MFIILILLLFCSGINMKSQCGKNEVASGCSNPCFDANQNCEKPPPRACPQYCRLGGCKCKEGCSKDTRTGTCMLTKYCPLPGSECQTHETYSECGANCQRTCSNPHPRRCKDCEPGYVCNGGFFRHNKTCIPFCDCPK